MDEFKFTRALAEEIICALWVIAALLAFNGGHEVFGTLLAIKAGSDLWDAIRYAWREARAERKAKQEGAHHG